MVQHLLGIFMCSTSQIQAPVWTLCFRNLWLWHFHPDTCWLLLGLSVSPSSSLKNLFQLFRALFLLFSPSEVNQDHLCDQFGDYYLYSCGHSVAINLWIMASSSLESSNQFFIQSKRVHKCYKLLYNSWWNARFVFVLCHLHMLLNFYLDNNF